MATKQEDHALQEKIKEMIQDWMGSEEKAEAIKADPVGGLATYDLKVEDITPEDIDTCVAEMAPTYAASPHFAHYKAPAGQSQQEQVWATVEGHNKVIVNEYGDWTVVNDYSADTYIDQSTNIGDITAEGNVDLDLDIDNNAADDGGVVIDGNATDTNINTGDLEGVQATGEADVDDVATGGSTQVDAEDSTVVFGEGAGDITVDNSENTDVDVQIALGDDINQTTGDGSGIDENNVEVTDSPFSNVNVDGDKVEQETGIDFDLNPPGADPFEDQIAADPVAEREAQAAREQAAREEAAKEAAAREAMMEEME